MESVFINSFVKFLHSWIHFDLLLIGWDLLSSRFLPDELINLTFFEFFHMYEYLPAAFTLEQQLGLGKYWDHTSFPQNFVDIIWNVAVEN